MGVCQAVRLSASLKPKQFNLLANTDSCVTHSTAGRFNPYHDNMFTVLTEKGHGKFRSRTSHAYSGREIPDMEFGVNQQLATLIDVLRKNYATTNKLLDFGQISSYFTVDVITRLAFGKEFGFLADEEDKYNFLAQLSALWPGAAAAADVPWIRSVIFSKLFLTLLGPKSHNKSGFGALMGYVSRLTSSLSLPLVGMCFLGTS